MNDFCESAPYFGRKLLRILDIDIGDERIGNMGSANAVTGLENDATVLFLELNENHADLLLHGCEVFGSGNRLTPDFATEIFALMRRKHAPFLFVEGKIIGTLPAEKNTIHGNAKLKKDPGGGFGCQTRMQRRPPPYGVVVVVAVVVTMDCIGFTIPENGNRSIVVNFQFPDDCSETVM